MVAPRLARPDALSVRDCTTCSRSEMAGLPADVEADPRGLAALVCDTAEQVDWWERAVTTPAARVVPPCPGWRAGWE